MPNFANMLTSCLMGLFAILQNKNTIFLIFWFNCFPPIRKVCNYQFILIGSKCLGNILQSLRNSILLLILPRSFTPKIKLEYEFWTEIHFILYRVFQRNRYISSIPQWKTMPGVKSTNCWLKHYRVMSLQKSSLDPFQAAPDVPWQSLNEILTQFISYSVVRTL